MHKRNVYLCQVNNQYGNNVFLPYSVGLLQAYCQTIEQIRNNFVFKSFLYLREDIKKIANSLDNPCVVGISCYIWNWEYNKELARNIRVVHPDCLIIFGGPQVPLNSIDFFQEHPYIDVLVHYEGELVFADILLETLREKPDYTSVKGLSVRVDGNHCFRTPPRERIKNVNQIPSPYLTGVFDEVMKAPYAFHASQETHRGCPYSCTFCDWGSATMNLVRVFDDQRLYAELEYFGCHKIDLLYNCDANYGLLPRDLELTKKMAEIKTKYGYPMKFRAAYAKNSNMKVFEIAKVLNNSSLCKGITLSFQSIDEHTLKIIKRFNIKINDFQNLMKLYRKENISTYSEIILGLPGETYDSFVEGISTLVACGQHDSLNVYTCAVLPNAEMAKQEYREVHGIKTVHVPVLLTHSTPSKDLIREYNDMVYETNTMPVADWQRAYLFSWAVQCFHCLSLTQYLAVFMHTEYGLSYRSFYEKLITFAENDSEGLIGEQYRTVSSIVSGVLNGGRWDMVIPKFGNICWPNEEGTFLNMIEQKQVLYAEIKVFFEQLIRENNVIVDELLVQDLLKYQENMVIDPYCPAVIEVMLNYNVHDYFLSAYVDEKISLEKKQVVIEIYSKEKYDNLETYARKVIWYGRKGGCFRHSVILVKQLCREEIGVDK